MKVDSFDEDLVDEIRLCNSEFIKYMESHARQEVHVTAAEKFETPSLEEYRPIYEAGVEDLSQEAIHTYLRRCRVKLNVPSRAVWNYLCKDRFLVPRDRRFAPTLAGLVVLGKDPGRFLTEHRIRAASFPGTPKEETSLDRIVDTKRRSDISGPLNKVVDETMKFFRRFAGRVPRIEGMLRAEEALEYPSRVIREAIVNALVHRDYSVAAHVTFRMFRDSIVVSSPGHLLRPNTLERVRSFDVTAVRRNARIAAAADSLKLMEKEGWGIRNMPAHLREYGLRPPDLDFDGGNFIVTFYGREKSSVVYRIPREKWSALNGRQRGILDLMSEQGRISSRDVEEKFATTRETANQDSRRLIGLHLIERRGVGKGTYYVLVM